MNSMRLQISEDHKYELISLENLINAFFKKTSDHKGKPSNKQTNKQTNSFSLFSQHTA